MAEPTSKETVDGRVGLYIGRPGAVGVCVGFGTPCLAVPVLGVTRGEITQSWREASESEPNMIEWRVDGITDPILENLGISLRDHFRIPVLVTLRTKGEGGRFPLRPATESEYVRLVVQASHWADAVDVEYDIPDRAVLIEKIHRHGAVAVLSKHIMQGPVDVEVAKRFLQDMDESGADIAKIAWMSRDEADNANLVALQRWAAEHLTMPATVLGMGEGSESTRLGEAAERNAITFAHVRTPSAPGQCSVDEIRVSLQ